MVEQNYIYSVLLGYEDPPNDITIRGWSLLQLNICQETKSKCQILLSDGLVEYNDGTEATEEQMAKDVVTFLAWAAEPHLRSKT